MITKKPKDQFFALLSDGTEMTVEAGQVIAFPDGVKIIGTREIKNETSETICLLEEKIHLLKAEKDHLSLELRYYEDRAHKAEKELHRMGSHGSVVAIPASRLDELERAEKALKALEGNVQPNRGES